MSLLQTNAANCPACDASQEFAVYSTVNVTVDPDLKRKVLDGTLNVFRCTACREVMPIETALLYHDMEKKLMVRLEFSDHSRDFEEGTLELMEAGYLLRQTNDYNRMLETVRIIDQGLNDRVVVKVREQLLGLLNQSIDGFEFHVFFSDFQKGLFKKKLVFEFFSHPSQRMQMSYEVKRLSPEDRKALFSPDGERGLTWQQIN